MNLDKGDLKAIDQIVTKRVDQIVTKRADQAIGASEKRTDIKLIGLEERLVKKIDEKVDSSEKRLTKVIDEKVDGAVETLAIITKHGFDEQTKWNKKFENQILDLNFKMSETVTRPEHFKHTERITKIEKNLKLKSV